MPFGKVIVLMEDMILVILFLFYSWTWLIHPLHLFIFCFVRAYYSPPTLLVRNAPRLALKLLLNLISCVIKRLEMVSYFHVSPESCHETLDRTVLLWMKNYDLRHFGVDR